MEAGIDLPSTDAASPWSWDEFVENAKKITKDSNGNGPDDEGFDPDSISVYGTMMPTDWAKFIALLHTNGVGILNEAGDALDISTDYLLRGQVMEGDTRLLNQKVSSLTPCQYRHLENIIDNFIAAIQEEKEV